MKTKITIGVFIIMLVLFATFIVLPADTKSVLDENRTPASMPELTFNNIVKGSFCQDFETYLSDNVGMRGKLIDISNKLNDLKGSKSFGYITYASSDLGTGAKGADKGLLVADGKIMEIFKNKPEVQSKYIDMINHYAKKLPEKANLYSLVVPTQLEFGDKRFKGLGDSQKEAIDNIYSSVSGRVNCIDAYSALAEHKDEYIYFRTDHHWTTLGAYYAYKRFANEAGVQSADISEFDKYKAENFLGYLYRQARAVEVRDNPDTIYYYIKGDENLTFDATSWDGDVMTGYTGKLFDLPDVDETIQYSLFMGGNHSVINIETLVNNGRTLLIIKDSYADCFTPWLAHSFERIIAVDPRSYKADIGDILKEFEITDVLLMNYTFTTISEDVIELEKGIYK